MNRNKLKINSFTISDGTESTGGVAILNNFHGKCDVSFKIPNQPAQGSVGVIANMQVNALQGGWRQCHWYRRSG